MFQCFLIGREKRGIEDRVNLPLQGNAEAEGHAGDYFFDLKGASSLHLELFGSIHVKIGCFEPDFISHLPRGELGCYLFLHFLLGDFVGGR